MRETRSVSLPSVTRRPPTLSDGAEILCLWYRPCAPSLASRSHEQPVRYPCVKPVGFPNHLLSPSLPAPSLSGPVTSLAEPRRLHPKRLGSGSLSCCFRVTPSRARA